MTVASDHATAPVDDEREARIDAAIAAYYAAAEAGAAPICSNGSRASPISHLISRIIFARSGCSMP